MLKTFYKLPKIAFNFETNEIVYFKFPGGVRQTRLVEMSLRDIFENHIACMDRDGVSLDDAIFFKTGEFHLFCKTKGPLTEYVVKWQPKQVGFMYGTSFELPNTVVNQLFGIYRVDGYTFPLKNKIERFLRKRDANSA